MFDTKISRFSFFSIFLRGGVAHPKSPKVSVCSSAPVTLYDFEIGLYFKNRTKNNHSTSIKNCKNLHYFSIQLNTLSSRFMAAGCANFFLS